MLHINTVLGISDDEAIGRELHALSHEGAVETIILSAGDMRRRRIRVKTDLGTERAIALPRSERLSHGAVLWLDRGRAVVVKAVDCPSISFQAEDAASALKLGYMAGNLHWQVHFEGPIMTVVVQGNGDAVMRRLSPLLDSGKIRQVPRD